MFFSISTAPKNNFSHSHMLGRLHLGLDEGWSQSWHKGYQLFFKGYADSGRLDDLLDDLLEDRVPCVTGNFCVIYHDLASHEVGMINSLWRSCPVYVHENQVTNLESSDSQIWADSTWSLTQDFDLQIQRHDVIGEIETEPLEWDQALDQVHERLLEKTQSFLDHHPGTIKVFLSGGVDTLLVYSYLRGHADRVEMIWNRHMDFDRFWMLNSGTISKNWAYRQIHHWNQPSVLSSGAPGDEFMLRSPYTMHMWTQWHGVSILGLLENEYRDCYHNRYFSRPYHVKQFESDVDPVTDRVQQIYKLCDNVVNDFQHWHLGNTLTWTPLRDLEIFKIMLRLPLDQALRQIMDSDFSRALIERNCAGLTALLSDKKNTGDALANLLKFNEFS